MYTKTCLESVTQIMSNSDVQSYVAQFLTYKFRESELPVPGFQICRWDDAVLFKLLPVSLWRMAPGEPLQFLVAQSKQTRFNSCYHVYLAACQL